MGSGAWSNLVKIWKILGLEDPEGLIEEQKELMLIDRR